MRRKKTVRCATEFSKIVSAVPTAAISATWTMESTTVPFVFRIRSSQMMGSRDEYYMRYALKEAEQAYTEDEVPVGAVLVCSDEVVASSHNMKESTSDPTAHAELIAIREGTSKKGNWRLTDATLYVTKEPCVMCAGAMVNARLGRLVFGCRDERFGGILSQYQIASDPSLNHQITVVSGVLAQDCTDILKKFFLLRR